MARAAAVVALVLVATQAPIAAQHHHPPVDQVRQPHVGAPAVRVIHAHQPTLVHQPSLHVTALFHVTIPVVPLIPRSVQQMVLLDRLDQVVLLPLLLHPIAMEMVAAMQQIRVLPIQMIVRHPYGNT